MVFPLATRYSLYFLLYGNTPDTTFLIHSIDFACFLWNDLC